jgi:endonuclease VIII
MWKSEGCFLARVDPWRRLDRVSDEEVLVVVRGLQPLMRRSADGAGRDDNWVFERTGVPCRRCGTRIRSRGQGDDNRTTYWCPSCQE